jgi:hypothetical protein
MRFEVVIVVTESWLLSQLRIAVSAAQGQFGNPDEGECPLLEAVIRRLAKT